MLHVRCPHCAKRSRVTRWVAHLFRGGETDDPRTRSRGRIAYERCQRPDTTRVNKLPHDTPVSPFVGQVEVRDLPQRHASCKDGWPIALAVGESDRYKRARELRGRSRASTVPYPCRPCRATCCTYDACVARSGVESPDGWPISSEVGKPMIHVQDRADALRTRDANVRTLHGSTSCRMTPQWHQL